MLLFLILSTIATFVLYGRALQAPFYLDDFIVLNGAETLSLGTRTLGFASFWLSHRLADLLGYVFPFEITLYYRLPNLLIHALTATAVFWLARELSGRRLTAAIAGGLFLVHPVQTQAITYISQRFESQAALFMMISAAAYVHFRKGGARLWLWLTILAAIAAALTKENALALPLWLFVIEVIFFSGMPNLKRLLYWAPLLLAMAYPAYLAFLSSASTLIWIPFEFYLLSQCRVIFTYLKLVFWPLHQYLWYDVRPVTEITPLVAAEWLTLIAIAAIGIYLCRHRPLAGLGILTFFILLSPTSVIPLPDLVFEHRVYPAFAGVALAVAAAFRPNRRTLAMFCVLFLVLGYRTYVRNGEWNDRIKFFEAHRDRFPEDPKSLASLGTAYATRGEIRKAIDVNLQARRNLGKLNSFYYRSVSTVVDLNLALLYTGAGDMPRAREEAQRVLAVQPDQLNALAVLGDVLGSSGDLEGSRKAYEKIVALDPGNIAAWKRLKGLYGQLGEPEQSQAADRKTLEIHEQAVEQEAHHQPSARYQHNALFIVISIVMLLGIGMAWQIAIHVKEIWFWVRTGRLPTSTVSVEAPFQTLRDQ